MKHIIPIFLILIIASLACGRSARNLTPSEGPEAPPIPQSTAQPLATPAYTEDRGVTTPAPTSGLPPVPKEYQALYAELEADLDAYLATLEGGREGAPVFAAELMYANGNLGTYLLDPGVIDAAGLLLDTLQSMGVQGVGVQISYPLLLPDFPRSAEFLDFYKQVAQQVRARKMVLLVETGPVFREPQYSADFGQSVDYSDLTSEEYFRTKREMLEIIAREIRPDYLALGNEPGTEKMLTRLEFSQQAYFDFVNAALEEIGALEGVKIGAGAGTWEDSDYLDYFIRHPDLDFINIHIYPIGSKGRILERAAETASLAKQAGKEVVIGEAWLYKTGKLEWSANYNEIYRRDAYSFWEPLDEKFIQALAGIAVEEGIDMLSFFWTRYFLAYVEYGEQTRDLSALELSQLSNRLARSHLLAGELSPLGYYFQELILAEKP